MNFLISWAIGVGLLVSNVHPLHVSVTEIEFDKKDRSLEIIIRIFTDDMELALRNQHKNKHLNILQPIGTTTDKLVSDYLASHLKISLDNKVQKTHYLGHELDGDALIGYIEVKNVNHWKVIEVMNNSIIEIHDDQSNIINVTVGDDVKSMRLMEGNLSGKLAFE